MTEHIITCRRNDRDYTVDCDPSCPDCQTLIADREATGCETPGHHAYCGSLYERQSVTEYKYGEGEIQRKYVRLRREAYPDGNRQAYTECGGKCGRDHRVLIVDEAESMAGMIIDILPENYRDVMVGCEDETSMYGPARRVRLMHSECLVIVDYTAFYGAYLAVEKAGLKGAKDGFTMLNETAWAIASALHHQHEANHCRDHISPYLKAELHGA